MRRPYLHDHFRACSPAFAGICVLLSGCSQREQFPGWAHSEATAPDRPGAWNGNKSLSLPGSGRQFSEAQTHDFRVAPDGFPDDHPPAPSIVLAARPGKIGPCGYCHLPDGFGRPENASM